MLSSDLKLFKSSVISDAGNNGGREGYSEVQSGQMQNVFPAVSSDEREAGGTRKRKVFFRALADAVNARAFISSPSTAEDFYALVKGDHLDVQSDLTGTEKQHTTGKLAQAASAGATQIVVTFDDASETDLEDGDLLWLSGGNGQQFNTVSGTPSWNGNQATITLASQLNVDYPIDSICAMVVTCGNAGELKPYFDSWVETSTQGTYDENTYPLEFDHQGAVRDDWTLTITQDLGGGVMGFSVAGIYEGDIGTGRTDQDFSPINPNTGTPYFTLRAAGWGGTWQVGDTITFKTYPPSQGLWLIEIWKAGANSDPDNQTSLRLYAE